MTYRVTTADGRTRHLWERNLRFMAGSGKDGPAVYLRSCRRVCWAIVPRRCCSLAISEPFGLERVARADRNCTSPAAKTPE